MKIKNIFLSILAITALVGGLFAYSGSTLAKSDKAKGPSPKEEVCHYTEGVNEYLLISVNENAIDAHLSHGDNYPGSDVPGMPHYIFTDDCSYEFVRSAEITSPESDEEYHVGDQVLFAATLWDKDGDDSVQWAVRKGTCAAGQGTVYGNVDGHSDSFDWDGMNFASTADTTDWEIGSYCFVFNPTESVGDVAIHETREFSLLPELCDVYTVNVDSVNGNSSFTHDYEITSCPGEEPTGEWISGAAGLEHVTAISLLGDVLSFTAEYDSNGYTWYPSFTLENDNSLSFIDNHGPDNVHSATGTWSMTQE